MTELLIRTFIRDSGRVDDPAIRSAYGKLAGVVGIVCNILLFAGKLAAGLLFGSIAVTADAVNNLSDASSSIVTLVGFKLAERPADEGHPFGHARIEYLAGLVVALLILVIGVELLKTSIKKIVEPTEVTFTLFTAVVLLASILVKLWMALFNTKLGKRISSTTLTAAAADSRNDVISTGAVLIAGIFAHFSGINIDGYVGLLVALFIIYSGFEIAKDTINPILGAAADPDFCRLIAEKIRGYDGVLGTHDLVIHDYGPGRRFASVHVEMDMKLDPLISHDIIDNIEREFAEKEGLELVIHYDPITTDDEELNHMKSFVCGKLAEIDPRLSLHDFRMVRGPMHTNLIFDLVMPYCLMSEKARVLDEIEASVQSEDEKYYIVVNVDSDSFNRD